MNSSKRKRDISKIQRQNVDPLWNVQNQQLKTEAEANSRLRQQITKQSYADSAVQADIKDKIQLLKQKAVALAKNLQSQKRKNIELEAIIRHMNFIREQEKKVQATHRDDMNFENLDNLSKKIKKSEYDLEQMFAKLNDLTSKNKQRKHEVDTYRTQRVIDSGIFLKIEKQIIQEETNYKKLLIQKTKYEQEYNKSLQNYKKMKNDIQKEQYISLSKRSSAEKPDQHEQFFINIPQIEHAVKFTQINYNQPKRKSFIGSKRNFSIVDLKKQQQKEQMQYAVKKVFMQTGLNNADTLIECLQNIDNINQELFMKVNKDSDSICDLTKQINNLKSKRKQKTIKYYEGQPQMTKTEIKIKQAQNIQAQINKIDSVANKITKSLQQLQKTNELRQIGKITNIQIFKQEGLDSLQSLFTYLEHKLNPILVNYAQFKKGLSMQESLSARKQKQGQIKQQSIQDLINKVRRVQQSQKIMVKQDFQREYEQIRKNQGNKSRTGKKKTTFVKKGH